MEELTELLNTLNRLRVDVGIDPARLVALHKGLPLWTAGVLVGAGLLACLFGASKFAFRLVLAAPAAGVGWILGPYLAKLLHIAPAYAAYGATGLLGALALAYPPAVIFLAGGAGGAWLGGELAEKEYFLVGTIAGGVVAGAFAVFLSRFLSILISALVGAACFSLGAVALLSTTRFAGLVLGYPSVTVAAACCLAVLSIAYQHKFAPSEEEVAKKRAELARQKELLRDAKDREKRFKNYGKSAKG